MRKTVPATDTLANLPENLSSGHIGDALHRNCQQCLNYLSPRSLSFSFKISCALYGKKNFFPSFNNKIGDKRITDREPKTNKKSNDALERNTVSFLISENDNKNKTTFMNAKTDQKTKHSFSILKI
jgi:hypothetical protein